MDVEISLNEHVRQHLLAFDQTMGGGNYEEECHDLR
jgi:hypothetical protein